ncbi:hypothetical protein MNBD_UNCLBAC01-1827 [hydrothermal vent metagenome]|uniref:HTH domain of SpoOJ/ParA/ParB/repB family, involved in chromosome partitioning n=1 Tax=hydrothermal vent metagenome TaxID=652676 RepID=A0A3B1D203_9ZZZZ
MSNIKPFQAIYYNEEKVEDFKNVMCPPYDVISEEGQNYFHNLSPYNFTHIDLAKDKKSDDKENNKYTRAQKTFESWLKKKVMIQDEKPGIYFYKQEYKIRGEKYSRLGFISLMELQSEEDSRVYPHEKTHAKAVDDRLQLTKALSSNLSCIFVCYSDSQRKVEKIFNKHILAKKPLIDVMDEDGVHHKLWPLNDSELIEDINNSLSGQHLFIADGHHRFKVANEYRKQRLSRKTNITGEEPFNYVMTYFTNIDSRELQIFPMHRIVKKMPKDLEFLEEFFRIDKVKNKDDLLVLLAKAGRNEHAFGLYTSEGIKLLRLKNKLLIEENIKEGSIDYKSLDATILKHFVFDRVGVISDDIIYTKDLDEVTGMVDEGDADAGFVMNAVKISQLKAIALNGEKMPPKTTYFYPKVLSGLTVYKMD